MRIRAALAVSTGTMPIFALGGVTITITGEDDWATAHLKMQWRNMSTQVATGGEVDLQGARQRAAHGDRLGIRGQRRRQGGYLPLGRGSPDLRARRAERVAIMLAVRTRCRWGTRRCDSPGHSQSGGKPFGMGRDEICALHRQLLAGARRPWVGRPGPGRSRRLLRGLPMGGLARPMASSRRLVCPPRHQRHRHGALR
jgi:hypothetical protein